ncbi:hypothetical protein FAES_4000 [Fibrella aestuarina BUZ 2]|uniref:Uncharacterized protein n=1 Tax=Fibrella aestuarina BUZ 2 TaxID=1166018 RepID=I0KCZ8_9BACT|nr:hypothetical protein [Fibrella aestuarina]CCH02001.1 hypothetical protein FAES_4000 [Fibrella aestuarina BUZ 2]
MKLTTLKRSLILNALLIGIVLVSCKETDIDGLAPAGNQLTVSLAKELYTNKYKGGRSGYDESIFGNPDWAKSIELKDKNGNTFIQTPLNHQNTVITVSSSDASATASHSSQLVNPIPSRQLVLYKNEKGDPIFRVMETVPDANVDLKRGDLLSGEVSYYDLTTRRLLDGFKYVDGKPTKFFRTAVGRDLLANNKARGGYQWVERLKCYYNINWGETQPDGATAYAHYEYANPYEGCTPQVYIGSHWYINWSSEIVYEAVWNDNYYGTDIPPGSGNPPTGGGPSPGSGDILDKIVRTNSLDNAAQQKLRDVLKEYVKNCYNKAVYDYFSNRNLKFDFSINPNSQTPAYFSYSNGSIAFQSSNTIELGTLTEELFHAYQDHYYGGLAQYSNTGRSNIEFEAKLGADIVRVLNNEGCCMTVNPSDAINTEYYQWIISITDGGTKFPSNYAQIQDRYFYFLQQFKNTFPAYNFPTNANLLPNAMLSNVNQSNCGKR